MTGYDFDGVWTAGVRPPPGEQYAIITGSLWNDWPRVRAGLSNGVDAMPGPVYMRPSGVYGDQAAAGQWKALMVGLLGVTRFIEDDPVQARIIKERNRGCTVMLFVGGGLKEVV